jgi:hypothetical protein
MDEKSFMGIEFLDEGRWFLIGVNCTSYNQALKDAPALIALVAPGAEYRVRRLTEEEYLAHANFAREHPAFKCPQCDVILIPTDSKNVLQCEQCKKYFAVSNG